MLLDKFVRWVKREVTDRSGLLSTATALIVDGNRRVEVPQLITFAEWLKHGREQLTPPNAVAFLQIFSDWTVATIVDVEKHQIPVRVQLPTDQLGDFSAAFLRPGQPNGNRSILLAPKWFIDTTQVKSLRDASPSPAMMAMATAAKGDGDGAAPAGIVAPGERPPKGPRVEALVTLAEETAIIQTLPVITGQPLEA